MNKKRKHHRTSAFSSEELRQRIDRARQEGRFQQALELTKQLYKYEPTPAHLDLLREVYLGRARQLRHQGQTREALTVLEVLARLDGLSPAWLEQLAQEMALCGEVRQTLALIDKLADPACVQRILAYVADTVVQQEAAASSSSYLRQRKRDCLPPSLQAELDCILCAFAQVEAGQDEAARETLQRIGLRSPFLEWKLLLRGLQAYWQNDNARALENWQRLTPDRLPARLAAPFRFHIDAAFRAAQPLETQALLQKQIDSLQDSTLLSQQLRDLQTTLVHADKLSTAFRQVEALLPLLRQEAPHLVPRLANCFYWQILETGPDDILRYQRIFGQPPDDPYFNRLRALSYEKAGELHLAHKYWQQYEQDIAAHPEKWPGEQANHARALIWQRMGQNAVNVSKMSHQSHPLLSLFGFEQQFRLLDPPVEKCFQKSLELAPNLLETHEAQIRYHLENKQEEQAEQAAQQLLQHFPKHISTLELLSDLRRKRGDYAAALELIERALQENALDRALRRKASDAHLLLARSFVESDRFDEARQHFQAALELSHASDSSIVLAHWAACEFKVGETARAEELLQQALNRSAAPVGVSYLLLTEVVRLKLDHKLKKRFDQAFKSGLQTLRPEDAVFLTRVLASLHSGGVHYFGQKSHTQKVLSSIQKSHDLALHEPQLEALCRNLLEMEAYSQARRLADIGERNYCENPLFPYLHALAWIRQKGHHAPIWQVVPRLKRAQSLAQKQPPNQERDRMLEDIDKHLRELNPFSFDLLDQIFDSAFGNEDGDDDD